MSDDIRSEIEVVGDAVAQLIQKGILRRHAISYDSVERALGLPVRELEHALARLAARGYVKPRTASAVVAHTKKMTDQEMVAAHKAGLAAYRGGGKQASEKRKKFFREVTKHGEKVAQRYCRWCKTWKDLTRDNFSENRPGHFRTDCRECFALKQRRRYLSVAKREALNTVGLEFQVVESDDIVGLRCTDCGNLIAAGDEVSGSAELRHQNCRDYVEPPSQLGGSN